VLEILPSMHEPLSLVPSTKRKKKIAHSGIKSIWAGMLLLPHISSFVTLSKLLNLDIKE
jgi:hypothetical protein